MSEYRMGRRPSRPLSIAVSAALVVVWGYLRLVVFSESHVPIAYFLPLLVSLWTRDRRLLWLMAAAFTVFHTLKIFWILPTGAISNHWAIYGSTVANILVGAAVLHVAIALRARLDAAFARVQAQADELQVQREELAQQNEALSQQGEELANQNEELQSQTEEISALNEALERRERLLQALLETARASGTERDALDHITAAARDLFPDHSAAVRRCTRRRPHGLRLRAYAGRRPDNDRGLRAGRACTTASSRWSSPRSAPPASPTPRCGPTCASPRCRARLSCAPCYALPSGSTTDDLRRVHRLRRPRRTTGPKRSSASPSGWPTSARACSRRSASSRRSARSISTRASFSPRSRTSCAIP
jgi:hypothetical protein